MTPGPPPTFSDAICAALRLTRPPGMLPEPLGPSAALSGTREKSRFCMNTGSRVECDAYSVTLPRSSAKLLPNSTSYCTDRPSLSDVSPNCDDTWRPSKSSRSRKFTAPAIASEPYTAEAPPVMISTRSTSAVGIVARSTLPAPFAGMKRLPLTSVSVRVGAEAAQVRGEHARAAGGIHAGIVAGRQLRQLVDHRFDGGIAGQLHHVLVDDGGRTRRAQIAAHETRAGDHDLRQRLLRLLLRESRTAARPRSPASAVQSGARKRIARTCHPPVLVCQPTCRGYLIDRIRTTVS